LTEPYELSEIRALSALLIASFMRRTGRELIAPGEDAAARLFHAPFGLVAHGTQKDPIFCYGNQLALKLFKMSWDEFTAMPSQLSAEPDAREERENLLREAREKGYVDTYSGVRIAKDGTRFRISDTVLWDVTDDAGARRGMACVICDWGPLSPAPR
jgi:hypothetical protein